MLLASIPAIIPGGSGLLLLLLFLYLLPTAVAVKRAHHQLPAILIVNVFLGWTFLGWVIALAMAFTAVDPPPPKQAARPGPPGVDASPVD
ncbi:MAG TPA: superinfection immunity protein [Solirubrobacteraceae bacterium]|nr:superinfection immunity protein [Solirubrobacteraceae bacterium]